MQNSHLAPAASEAESGAIQASIWKDFLALIKIGIVNSNVVTVFTGLFLAFRFSGRSFLNEFDIVAYALLGSALIMAGASAMNNYIDRDIDPIMKRTKSRPTVTGRFSPPAVLSIALSFMAIGEALLFMTTPAAGLWGIAGIAAYVVVYSLWSKRRHVSNTIVGSVSGAIPPLIGWAAVQPELGSGALALFLIMFAWQPPHFYALAMKRTDEYRAAGIPMLPVVKGFARTKRSMAAWVLALLPIPFLLPELGPWFLALATALNAGWLALALAGFRAKDDLKWAMRMFVYSLNYMTILFVSMVIFAIFI